MKDKIKTIVGMTLFVVIIIGFLIGIYLFGIAGVFAILGVQYQSNWSLFIFVISVFILGLLVDVVFSAMADILVDNVSGKKSAFAIQFLFGFATNWIVIFTVDTFMSSIRLSIGTILILSLLLTTFEAVLSGDDKSRGSGVKI